MSLMRRMAAGVALCYATGFVMWRLLVASPLYEQWWPLQVSEILGVWLLLPVPFLALAGLRWPSRWLWLALAMPLLWFGREYGGLFMPEVAERARASAADDALRVMTFNTWANSDGRRRFEDALREWEPDIVALQEVSSSFSHELDDLADVWPYQVRATLRSVTRVAVLSKLPILSERADNDRLGCHCLELVLDDHGRAIRVIVVHIRAPSLGTHNRWPKPLQVRGFDASAQTASYEQLQPLVTNSDMPLIVLGDFNTTERQAGYRMLQAAGLKNAHEEIGWSFGFTYPAPSSRVSWLPVAVIRIDHVFYNEKWRATQAWTQRLMGSDHKALVVDLQGAGRE